MAHHLPQIHALLFGLTQDLAGELMRPLTQFCTDVKSTEKLDSVEDSAAEIIFCGADVNLVNQLRAAKPEAPIVVVSRHAEVSHWLDSIEAGATDYCAAPFETAQMKWIVESSMRSVKPAA